eukprot:TRINITY_DN18103_c0_g1_i8.p2 TRINITY_DN18103_c0_g1~~TRINITY_DN18103_c0_g1_i8.p2  ORF type:complete len:187 (+),score=42.65 TRINITY_DN18103_c0_g1_i8:89-649(+)
MLAGSGDGRARAAEPAASAAPSPPGWMDSGGPESPTQLSPRPSQPPPLEDCSPDSTPRRRGGPCGAGGAASSALNPAAAPWRPGGGSEVAAEQADACPACAPLVQRQAVRLACLEEQCERQALIIERQAAELQEYRAAELALYSEEEFALDSTAELAQDSTAADAADGERKRPRQYSRRRCWPRRR